MLPLILPLIRNYVFFPKHLVGQYQLVVNGTCRSLEISNDLRDTVTERAEECVVYIRSCLIFILYLEFLAFENVHSALVPDIKNDPFPIKDVVPKLAYHNSF